MSKYDYKRITEYVEGEMDPGEKVAFEEEMEADPGLRKEVHLYKTIDQQAGLAATLGKLNRQYFPDAQKQTHKVVSIDRGKLYRRIASVAAVLVVFAASYFVIFRERDSVQQMADKYINTSLTEISPNAAATTDSLQAGIQAYNVKNYLLAENIFIDISRRNASNLEATEYLGMIYLQRKEYNKAIQQFDSLIKLELHNNPGYFLKSVALIKRNAPADLATARSLLNIVVEKRYQGHEEAMCLLIKSG